MSKGVQIPKTWKTTRMKTSSRSKFYKHVPCSKCDSSDAMAVYEQEDGTYDATCFSCGHYDPDPMPGSNGGPKQERATDKGSSVKEYTTLTVSQLSECHTRSILSRGIKETTTSFYGVRTILNGLDGQTPVAVVFPYYKYSPNSPNIYLSGYKKRLLESKVFSSIGDTKDTFLFGQSLFLSGGKKLYITEGEIDCLTLYQVLKESYSDQYRHIDPCVVSIPHGSNSAAHSLSLQKDFLDKFQEIVLCFDQDEAGQEAVAKACSFLDPSKVKVASFSEKDANDMLMANKSRELLWSVLSNAKPYVPSGITTSQKLLTEPLRPSESGYEWPWPSLSKLTYGIRPNLYGVGAGVGVGKTEFFHEIIYNLAVVNKRPTGVFLLEELPRRTLTILAGKSCNKPLHRPDVELGDTSIEDVTKEFVGEGQERIYFFDHKGSRDWTTIFSQCKYLATVHGVQDIIIDPITSLISHEENTDRALHSMMSEMYQLTQDPYNCAVYYSSHLNEPPRDRRPHEEGGRVMESQFAGSRAMIRFSDWIIGLERNKQAPDLIDRNTTTVRILKDREFGTSTGETFEVQYDPSTGRYLESDNEF